MRTRVPPATRCHNGAALGFADGRRSRRSIPSPWAVGERRLSHTPRASKRRSGSPSVPGTRTVAAAAARSQSVWSPSIAFASTPWTEPVTRATKSVATGSVLPTCAEATPGSAAAIATVPSTIASLT
ncbi:MAG: hypothetical protein E6F98_16120 [Actinobacteria bacterium]|nr:MAG: hypothetical protein E6F98_16120 [Actinomycetota bacterium]